MCQKLEFGLANSPLVGSLTSRSWRWIFRGHLPWKRMLTFGHYPNQGGGGPCPNFLGPFFHQVIKLVNLYSKVLIFVRFLVIFSHHYHFYHHDYHVNHHCHHWYIIGTDWLTLSSEWWLYIWPQSTGPTLHTNTNTDWCKLTGSIK